jgi:NAD(P)-dependent dehydrogenase (short-subunit alcohol dehydrogenase family)
MNGKSKRTAIVTGASRGLGRAMTLGLLRAGWRVVLVSTGPSAPLESTLASARALGAESDWLVVHGDLRLAEDCDRVAKESLARFGVIDALVNNAAIPNNGEGEPFWKVKPDDWFRVVRTNCDSVFLMSRSIAPHMLERGAGRIINISTSGRTMVRPRFSPYGPSKAFVDAASRMWAAELEGTGVSMNVLAPGGLLIPPPTSRAPPKSESHFCRPT